MPSFLLAASSFAVGAEVREVKRGRIIEDIKTGGNARHLPLFLADSSAQLLLDSFLLAFEGVQFVLEFLSQLFGHGGVPTSARCLKSERAATVGVELLPLTGVFFGFVGRGSCNVVRDRSDCVVEPSRTCFGSWKHLSSQCLLDFPSICCSAAFNMTCHSHLIRCLVARGSINAGSVRCGRLLLGDLQSCGRLVLRGRLGDVGVGFCDLGAGLVDPIIVVAGLGVQIDAFTVVLSIYL